MSLLHSCPDCGAEYETGLSGEGGLCNDCERVEERMSGGGRGLSLREHGAVLAFHELVLTADNNLVRPDSEMIGSLVLTDDGNVIDAATLDGERAVVVA